MRNVLRVSMTVLSLACGIAAGAGMSRQDYQAAKKRIEAQYQAERQKCGTRYGNALDMCVARAHGIRDVAKAELEAEYKPGPRPDYDAAIARAKAAYNLAKEECDDVRGAERTACIEEAKAALAQARAKAKSRLAAERAEAASKPAVR